MKRLATLASAGLVSVLVSINGIAFMQARAMTRFVERGDRTAPPEQLGLLQKLRVVVSGVNIPRPQNSGSPAQFNLAFKALRFPNANDDTLDAWYVPGQDHGPMVLLFHGYAASKSSLLSAARVFNELGYAVLLVDFYGSGASSGSGTMIGVKEAEDVTATVAYARHVWPARKIVLYGSSMGGAAILRAIAKNNLRADGIVIEAVFDNLLNTSKNRFRSMGLPGSPFAELLLFWGSVQGGFNFFSHNPADDARSVRCPALILHGENDVRVTVAEARRIAAAIGKSAQFIAYSGVPHMAIVDAQPGRWKRDVEVFLKQF